MCQEKSRFFRLHRLLADLLAQHSQSLEIFAESRFEFPPEFRCLCHLDDPDLTLEGSRDQTHEVQGGGSRCGSDNLKQLLEARRQCDSRHAILQTASDSILSKGRFRT